jgi:hypothetical protein
MATAQTTNDLTRQQLDELDALLQKMLALPLNPPEGSAPPLTASRAMVSEIPLPEMPPSPPRVAPTPSYTTPVTAPFPISNGIPPTSRRADPPHGPTSTPQLLVMPTKVEVVTVAPTHRAANIQLRVAEPNGVPTPTAPKFDIPTKPVLAPLPNTIPDPAPAPLSSTQPKPARVESIPPILAPLVAFNRGINFALGQLGLPGRALRTGFAKNLLALSGLALLAYTAAKVAQTQGLATFSMVLPWPG